MAQDNTAQSDPDFEERPVREQLKKASIAGLPAEVVAAVSGNDPPEAEHDDGLKPAKAELQRKRSHEELEGDRAVGQATAEDTRHHRRKRSRDSTAEEEELNNGQRKTSGEKSREEASSDPAPAQPNGKRSIELDREGTPDADVEARAEAVASPKTKRSRLYSAAIEEQTTGQSVEGTQAADTSTASNGVTSKIPPTSGFANSSASSPFTSLAGNKSDALAEKPQTSASAFAASGFGSLAASSSSGFGAIGKSAGGFGTGGSFATGAKSPLSTAVSSPDHEKSAVGTSGSTFGGALGQKSAFASAAPASSFGSAASGFGKLGAGTGGFGGSLGAASPFASGSGGGLTSFASGKGTPLGSSSAKPARAFGAPAEDDDENEEGDDEEGSGIRSPLHQEEDKQDERFHEQHIETGEEGEETLFSCRAKLYAFSAVEGKKEWRERGLGTLRLNCSEKGDKTQARFLMRADGSHRVALNSPIKKEFKFGAADGGPPQSGYFMFMGTIDGSTGVELLQLKMRQQFADELYQRVTELKEKF
ncbi:Ran-binding domain [Teratosphaeria destructans]|uniref:Ran-binding domain n=1 Tax=Teratosphaeria destructans TaxID=418781 RepID=A0A9W7SYF8_9PEZI|nr:Ran-binding domain [Teratosphaeria destructans]